MRYITDENDRRAASLNRRIQRIYSDSLETIARQTRSIRDQLDTMDADIAEMERAGMDATKEKRQRKTKAMELLRKTDLAGKVITSLREAGGHASRDIQATMKDCYAATRGVAIKQMQTDIEDTGTKMSVSFTQYDDHELDVLMQDEQSPFSKIAYNNLGRQTAVRTRLQNEMAQSVVLGESQQKMMERIRAVTGQSMAQAMRVAQTERTRVQSQARHDAGAEAAEAGVQVYYEWSCAKIPPHGKGGGSRDSHIALDGQKVMEGEKFVTIWGNELEYPGDPSAPAEEVINCHCVLIPRVLKSSERLVDVISEDTGEVTGRQAETITMDVNEPEIEIDDILKSPVVSDNTEYNEILSALEYDDVEYNPVERISGEKTEDSIIADISGGDMTKGSCASLALAYTAQKLGFDVVDYRGGSSQSNFSLAKYIFNIMSMATNSPDAIIRGEGKTQVTVGKNILTQCETGHEYYFASGRHAAMVRKVELNGRERYQYLELQSNDESRNGWQLFDGNPRYTLSNRFGCYSSSDHSVRYNFMVDIANIDPNNKELRSLLGFINTGRDRQRKGVRGGTR